MSYSCKLSKEISKALVLSPYQNTLYLLGITDNSSNPFHRTIVTDEHSQNGFAIKCIHLESSFLNSKLRKYYLDRISAK